MNGKKFHENDKKYTHFNAFESLTNFFKLLT